MRTGRYLEAKGAYQQAPQIYGSNTQAQFALRHAALPELKLSRENFGTELDALLKGKPDDKDLLLLDGDRYYYRNEFEEAGRRYQALLSKDAQYPEALFRVGVLSELQRDVETAKSDYQAAVNLSPDTLHYRNNLAYLYFRQGDYDRAIAEYGLIDRYPLATLEAAKAHWAKDELPEARDAQSRAIGWLGNEDIASLPRNLGPWLFNAGAGKNTRLVSNHEKLCYAPLSLSATLFMEGKTAESTAQAAKVPTTCPAFVRSALAADLTRVKGTRPDSRARSRRTSGRIWPNSHNARPVCPARSRLGLARHRKPGALEVGKRALLVVPGNPRSANAPSNPVPLAGQHRQGAAPHPARPKPGQVAVCTSFDRRALNATLQYGSRHVGVPTREEIMKRTVIVVLQSLLVASASVAASHADESIGPGHPRWYGNGSGPTGADLIAWVSQHATKAPSGNPDPVYFGRSGGPVGADLIAKLATVQRQDRRFDLVNAYGRGAPSVAQLTLHATQEQPVLAAAPARVVK